MPNTSPAGVGPGAWLTDPHVSPDGPGLVWRLLASKKQEEVPEPEQTSPSCTPALLRRDTLEGQAASRKAPSDWSILAPAPRSFPGSGPHWPGSCQPPSAHGDNPVPPWMCLPSPSVCRVPASRALAMDSTALPG